MTFPRYRVAMTAVCGNSMVTVITRCAQVLQLVMDTVSAVLHSAFVTVKSTYQVLRPPPAKSLAGEIVLVCTDFGLPLVSSVQLYKVAHCVPRRAVYC